MGLVVQAFVVCISVAHRGNSLGTGPGGGNVQNVYIGENSWQHVYGNDREALTGDCQGGAYYGTLASVRAEIRPLVIT